MNTFAEAWLQTREPAAPDGLRARMIDALRAAEGDSLPELLAHAAALRLESALALGDAREAAFDLLAADGLLTYACEAAASAGVTDFAGLFPQTLLDHLEARST